MLSAHLKTLFVQEASGSVRPSRDIDEHITRPVRRSRSLTLRGFCCLARGKCGGLVEHDRHMDEGHAHVEKTSVPDV